MLTAVRTEATASREQFERGNTNVLTRVTTEATANREYMERSSGGIVDRLNTNANTAQNNYFDIKREFEKATEDRHQLFDELGTFLNEAFETH